MITWHGLLLREMDSFWNNVRRFAFNNPTIFEIFFLFVYSIEQIALVLFVFYSPNVNSLTTIISLFSIVVLGTFAFHKLVMGSRIRLLEDKLRDLLYEKKALETLTRELYYSSSQELNNSTSINNKKGDK